MAAESRPVSPFVAQKIRERMAGAAKEEPEETEEPDEVEEEGEDEEEHEEASPARSARSPEARRSHHAIGERSGERSGRTRGSSASLTDRASKFFKDLGPTQTWLLIGGGLLVANHLMVPRGTSVLSKMLNAVAPSPAKPRPVLRAPAYAYYAGANNQAGWNRGMTPYGPWGHAAPGGPSPYAHADDSWGW